MLRLRQYKKRFDSMDQETFLFLLLATLFCLQPFVLLARPQPRQLPTSHITVQGSVFCDPCHNNTFSPHSYFLPGVKVHIQCKRRLNSSPPTNGKEMEFSVYTSTNIYGVYKLDIPSVEGIDCMLQQPRLQTSCRVSLKGSPSSSCNITGLRSTTKEITLKSKRNNQCIYSMSALSYRPLQKNATFCRNTKLRLATTSPPFNSSKCFFPYLPPYYTIPWPQLPPLPQLPSFPLSPLTPLPSLPPLPPLPSLPPLPPLPSLPPLTSWPFPQVPSPTTPSPPSSPTFTFPPFPNFPQAPPLIPPPTPPAASSNSGDTIN